MAVIGSDFHGNLKKLDKFEKYKPLETHIFAGDAVDSWNMPVETQLELLERLVASNCILLYGNHELSYHSKIKMPCSGRHYFGIESFPPLIDMVGRWKVAMVVDGYLVTHAGLSSKYIGRCKAVKGAAGMLNKQFTDNSHTLYNVGQSRGGRSSSGHIFWYDFRYDWEGLAPINQVFGHCSLHVPYEEKTATYHHACINSNDNSDDCWVFDTEEKKIIIL